jgi:hypothetical protein
MKRLLLSGFGLTTAVGRNTAPRFDLLAVTDEAMKWPKIRRMAA